MKRILLGLLATLAILFLLGVACTITYAAWKLIHPALGIFIGAVCLSFLIVYYMGVVETIKHP